MNTGARAAFFINQYILDNYFEYQQKSLLTLGQQASIFKYF
jgi:hypothetical protein